MRIDLNRRPELSLVTRRGVQAAMEWLKEVDNLITDAQHPNKAILIGKDLDDNTIVVGVEQTGLEQTETQTFRPVELSPATRQKLFGGK